MEVPRRGAHELCDRGGECNHVVLGLEFDLVDAVNREVRLRLDGRSVLFRHDSPGGEGFGDGEFDIQPTLVFVLVLPDPAHGRPCVARYHSRSLTEPDWSRGVLLAR